MSYRWQRDYHTNHQIVIRMDFALYAFFRSISEEKYSYLRSEKFIVSIFAAYRYRVSINELGMECKTINGT